jgi:hypothetical protein
MGLGAGRARTVNAKIAANSPYSDIQPRTGATSDYGSFTSKRQIDVWFQAMRLDDTKLMSASRTN